MELKVRGSPLQPNPGSDDTTIRTKMAPGVADERVMGDPVTKEEIAKGMGQHRHPFHLMRADVREVARRIAYTLGCKGGKATELNYTSRPVHTDQCRQRMEAEMRKPPRGAERMQDYERKLADEIEERVRRENKIAKTQSAHEPENASQEKKKQGAYRSSCKLQEENGIV